MPLPFSVQNVCWQTTIVKWDKIWKAQLYCSLIQETVEWTSSLDLVSVQLRTQKLSVRVGWFPTHSTRSTIYLPITNPKTLDQNPVPEVELFRFKTWDFRRLLRETNTLASQNLSIPE